MVQSNATKVAGHAAGFKQVVLLQEPIAASLAYANKAKNAGLRNSQWIVYDLGGGTFDVCVLEKQDLGFAVLGSPDGLERFGGIDLDEAVLQHVLARLPDGAAGQDPDDPQVAAHLEQLRARCATAKEALSTEVETSIPVTLPGLDTTVRLTRTELDGLLDSPLRATVEATLLDEDRRHTIGPFSRASVLRFPTPGAVDHFP